MQRKADRVATLTIHIPLCVSKQLAAEFARRRNFALLAATKNKVLNGALTLESTMDRKPAVQVPDVSGIDLDYRPRNYFWAVDLNVPLTSGIAGETRRQVVRALLDWDTPIPDGLDAEVLDEAMREAWGAVHPSHMGGEYLPPLCKGEVEIARISLRSFHATSRRAGQPSGPQPTPVVLYPDGRYSHRPEQAPRRCVTRRPSVAELSTLSVDKRVQNIVGTQHPLRFLDKG